MKILIVDDEAAAVTVVKSMVESYIPEFTVVGSASDAISGIQAINRLEPDIVMLDVHMPGIDGLEMLSLIKERNFKVIVTSAHEHFAIRAIRQKVDDYLLKPFSVDELETVLEKLKRPSSTDHSNRSSLKVNNKSETLFIKTSEIYFIRAEGRYSEVYTAKGKFTISKNLGELESELIRSAFFRAHRSYLVNRHYVRNISKNDGGFIVMEGGTEIELSRRKKADFIRFMEG